VLPRLAAAAAGDAFDLGADQRSTIVGRLSSSQLFSIGFSMSLTRSSSVRALLLSTVCASCPKALVTDELAGRTEAAPCRRTARKRPAREPAQAAARKLAVDAGSGSVDRAGAAGEASRKSISLESGCDAAASGGGGDQKTGLGSRGRAHPRRSTVVSGAAAAPANNAFRSSSALSGGGASAGLTSSSAMIRRMEARISSIDGSLGLGCALM
jgi:hypothetical protein